MRAKIGVEPIIRVASYAAGLFIFVLMIAAMNRLFLEERSFLRLIFSYPTVITSPISFLISLGITEMIYNSVVRALNRRT